ncbi:MAG: hypothetical protein OXP73_02510 [Chloroflexota bacterium]|nr:hypothetical protein [Chloroflexota bacterium]
MPERPLNNPGRVLIAGENHIVRLQSAASGADAALFNHFRLRLSPHGPGHAVFVLADPNAADPRNACYTDNPALANWLLDWYLRGSPLYRNLKGLGNLPIVTAGGFTSVDELPRRWSEIVKAGDVTVRAVWDDLATPFHVERLAQPGEQDAMDVFSVLMSASGASLDINGRRIPGAVFPRQVGTQPISSAFLAFAESWVESA